MGGYTGYTPMTIKMKRVRDKALLSSSLTEMVRFSLFIYSFIFLDITHQQKQENESKITKGEREQFEEFEEFDEFEPSQTSLTSPFSQPTDDFGLSLTLYFAHILLIFCSYFVHILFIFCSYFAHIFLIFCA